MSSNGKPPHLSEAARQLTGPSAHARQRIRAGIDHALASGQVSDTVQRVDHAISSGAPISKASWLATKASLAKLLIPTLLIGVGAGVMIGRQTVAPRPDAFEQAPLRAEPAPAGESPTLPPNPFDPTPLPPEPAPRVPESPLPHNSARRPHHANLRSQELPTPEPILQTEESFISPSRAPAAPVGHHVAEELRLMHAASAALSARDWAGAERALSEHARRFPDGSLTQERHALRLISRCKQGERAKLKSDIAAFLRSAAQSPLAVRVREACEDAR